METKGAMRKRVLCGRDALPEEERTKKSSVIMKKITQMPLYREAEIFLSYVNYKSEVETEALILHALQDGKEVYCPRVAGEEMDFYRITSPDVLTAGYRGIREPEAEVLLSGERIAHTKNLMLMPGSVFDRERNRIGYGRGYYDKYLQRYPGLRTVGVCFDCQIQEEVPFDEYDRKPELVITEKAVYG